MRTFSTGISTGVKIAIGLFVALLVAAAVFLGVQGVIGDTDKTITVTDKDRVCSSNNDDCKYLVYTDHETFENIDSTLNNKHNSSDFQGRLKVGHTYRVKVEGYRSGWQSHYRNIIKIYGETK